MIDLRRRLVAVLEPLDGWRAGAAPSRSDYDLNPDLPLPGPEGLRPAAVLVPVVDRGDGPHVLMTRRADGLARHTGQIAFPGGRLEPGETAVQAALREAWEEVGLDAHFVEPLGLSDSYQTGTGFLVTPVVAWVRPGFALTLDPGEVADAFEVPWDFLMDAANHREDRLTLDDGVERRFWAMPWGERYIWGATAGMIRTLHDRLGARAEDAA